MQPVAGTETFRALARSSPWRWRNLRFLAEWHGRYPTWPEPVRAWVRRPDDLRVETAGGELFQAGRQSRRSTMLLTSDGRPLAIQEATPLDPRAPAPALDPNRLVAARPLHGVDYDDPMFQNYHWVAMLDPVELETCAMADVCVVDHYGRPAWEAVLTPTDAYEPRCSCCPLLHSAQSDELEYEASGESAPHNGPGFRYADAFRVRLDVATGVCVLTEQVGGSNAGKGHQLVIEAVDEPMPDDLFVEPRRGWSSRRRWPRR